MSNLDDAAANLARTTPLSLEQARLALGNIGAPTTHHWIDETQWQGALTVPDTETDPHLFMTQEGIDVTAFREALTEYRNLDTAWPGTPWAPDEIGVLSTDFINWFRWERL